MGFVGVACSSRPDKTNKRTYEKMGYQMNFGKWEILFWMPPPSWAWWWNHGWWPNARDKEFYFWNFLFIEVRHFAAFNKKVCKKCGKEV